MIKRALEAVLKNKVDYKKAIVLLGPRQVGKTTLITGIASAMNHEYLYINGDDPSTTQAIHRDNYWEWLSSPIL